MSRHSVILQEKINTYMRFLESSEIYEDYPEPKRQQLSIDIIFHYTPNPEALAFLSKLKPIVDQAGFGFRFQLFLALLSRS